MSIEPVTQLQSQSTGRTLSQICDEATHWYKDWYFDLRFEEELDRSSRYHVPLTLLAILLPDEPKKNDRRLLNEILSYIISQCLRRSDIAGNLGTQEYAVLLPHTSIRQADTVIQRLKKAFEPYDVVVATANCPGDGQDRMELLALAKHRAASSAAEPLRLVTGLHRAAKG